MLTGTVKFYNEEKGYGFIVHDAGGDDVFVHIKEVLASGLATLEKGQAVSYDLKESKGKMAATNIKLL
jgi:CspA family cold shock protein